MNNLKNYILNIFNNYPFTLKDSIKFAKNNLATSLRHGIRDINSIDKIINGDLFSKGSPGKSRWSAVPWFAIFDRNITKTAQHGIYIVYLFSADGSKVYLSLGPILKININIKRMPKLKLKMIYKENHLN